MQTFKLGDWVVEIHSEEIHQIIELFPDVCRVTKPASKITYSAEYTDFKPWQPQPGEWCWFWNDDNTLVLSQFAHGLSNGAKFTSKNLMYQYCEPFIGQLPPILQPQSKG